MMPGLRCVPNRETQFTLFSVSFRKTGYRFRNTIGELLLVLDVGFTESPGYITPDEVLEQA
jgi:hypothetical protein